MFSILRCITSLLMMGFFPIGFRFYFIIFFFGKGDTKFVELLCVFAWQSINVWLVIDSVCMPVRQVNEGWLFCWLRFRSIWFFFFNFWLRFPVALNLKFSYVPIETAKSVSLKSKFTKKENKNESSQRFLRLKLLHSETMRKVMMQLQLMWQRCYSC